MVWGEAGTDVKISALPVSMRFFDFRTVFPAFENIDFTDFLMFSY